MGIPEAAANAAEVGIPEAAANAVEVVAVSDADAESDARDLDDRAPLPAVLISVGAAFLAAAVLALTTPEAGAPAFLGLFVLAGGLYVTSARVVTWGAGIVALGVLLGGYAGGSVEGLVLAAVLLALAWDVGTHGISLGAHVGRDAVSRRNVLVHTGTNALVGFLTAGVAYGAYAAGTGGQPIAALAFLLFGAVVLASAFR